MASPLRPDSDIRIIKVDLDISNKNQISFSTINEQETYFKSKTSLEIEDCTYIRKDSILRVPYNIDEIYEYNYIMYKNEFYNDKYFYAYITNMQYINDEMTAIRIETDVFQTYQFDFSFKESFVEREMLSVSDDIAGANLVPESLECGEMTASSDIDINELKPVYVIAYSRDPVADGLATGSGTQLDCKKINGIPSGVYYAICNQIGLDYKMAEIKGIGHSDAIVTIFTIPAVACIGFGGKTLSELTSTNNRCDFWLTDNFYTASNTIKTLNARPSTLNGYTVRNKKLLTYPYCYLGFCPPNGNNKIFRFEDFSNPSAPQFKVISEVNPNPNVLLIPQNYRGVSGSSTQDLASVNGYPTISWITDYFNTWLAQNSNIIDLNIAQETELYRTQQAQNFYNQGSNIGNIAAGTALTLGTGGVGAVIGGGMMTSGFNDYVQSNTNIKTASINHDYYIKNQMAQIEKQQLLPNNATMSSSNATLLGFDLLKTNIFTVYTIRRQFAEKIDKFFDMYGYLTNMVKVPNLSNRPTWNYVKTIGANIVGRIPTADLENLKALFDNGLTIWHSTSNFLNYNANNR